MKINQTLFFIFLIVSFSIQAQEDYIYGLSKYGGKYDAGTLYKMKFDGTKKEVLYNFDFNNIEFPNGKHIKDQIGRIYGTSIDGGLFNKGTIYRYDPSIDTFEIIFNFNNDTIGYNPVDILFLKDSVTIIGQLSSNQNVFEFNIDNSSISVNQTLTHALPIKRSIYDAFQIGNKMFFSFNDSGGLYEYFYKNDSTSKVYRTINDSLSYNKPTPINDSIFIGTATNQVTDISYLYEINVKKNLIILRATLDPYIHGNQINRNLIYNSGKLIGSCKEAGIHGKGTLFEFDLFTSSLDTILSFKFEIGGTPQEITMIDSNYLIGTCFTGGYNFDGTIFKYNLVTNQISILHDFLLSQDGSRPQSSLIKTDSNSIMFNTACCNASGIINLIEYNYLKDELKIIEKYNSNKFGAFPNSNLLQFGNILVGSASLNANLFFFNTNTSEYQFKFPYGRGIDRLIKIDSLSFLSYGKSLGTLSSLAVYDKNGNQLHNGGMYDGVKPIKPRDGDWLSHSNGKLYGCGYMDGDYNQGSIFEFDPINFSSKFVYHFNPNDSLGINPIASLIELNDNSILGISNTNNESILFKLRVESKSISVIDKLPFKYLEDDKLGISIFKDSLIFGLSKSNDSIYFFKYDLKLNQYNMISSIDKKSYSDIFHSPVIGNDNNIYINILKSNNYIEGRILKYDILNDSLFSIFSPQTEGKEFGLNPLEPLFLYPYVTSTNDIKSKRNSLSVYPNPFQKEFSVISSSKIDRLTLYNLSGKKLFEDQKVNSNKKVIRAQLKQGIYIVKIQTESGTFSRKIIKH